MLFEGITPEKNNKNSRHKGTKAQKTTLDYCIFDIILKS